MTAGSDPYRVHSLSGLDRADPVSGRIEWDAPRSVWNNLMLGTALVLGPATFEWPAFFCFLVLCGITLCAGHSVGFHRKLIHQSFDCPKWLERALVYLGTLVGMGGPLWTVRFHDTRDWAQRQPDCHWLLRHERSLLSEGFYYQNFRLRFDRPPVFDPGPELADDRFYRFLQSTWMLQQLPLACLLFWIGGWSWVIWGIPVRVSLCTTMHWMVSYYAHSKGPQDWLVDGAVIQAHNVSWAAIPTMGEAWHNNHHAFPGSARHGLYPGQVDIGWYFICLLERLGLAWNIQLPDRLPPRTGITPLKERSLSAASRDQETVSCRSSRPSFETRPCGRSSG
jgi:stearoyl-CoA desaturase (delta-9 desaturase)